MTRADRYALAWWAFYLLSVLGGRSVRAQPMRAARYLYRLLCSAYEWSRK